MKLLVLVALAAALLGGCRVTNPDDAGVIPTPLLDEARQIRRADGLEAALPVYLRAVDGGDPVEAGFAAVVLWDHHDARGDSVEAVAYRETALAELGDEAWVLWASRLGQDRRADGTYATDNLIVRFERLSEGIRAGSAAAVAEQDRGVQVLEAQAAQGNDAAQDLLERVRADGLDRTDGA